MNKLARNANNYLETDWIERLDYASAEVSENLNIITIVIVSLKFKTVSELSIDKQGNITTVRYSDNTIGMLEHYATAIYRVLEEQDKL